MNCSYFKQKCIQTIIRKKVVLVCDIACIKITQNPKTLVCEDLQKYAIKYIKVSEKKKMQSANIPSCVMLRSL